MPIDDTFTDARMRALSGAHRHLRDRFANRSTVDMPQEANMEKDVICGMQVDPAKAVATSEYDGKTYYFCSMACKHKFDANPKQYAHYRR